MITSDTIAAVSSATGRAARMIVRVSGPAAIDLARQLSPSLETIPGRAAFTSLVFNDLTVPAWIYLFQAPRSYTGDDLVEFHIAGNPLLAQMLMNDLLRRGARSAEPGEFTARAYFNGRIDLAEAEGIAATISAHSEGELRAARQLLSGELARRLRPIMDVLAETLALVEVGIDFSDEDVTFLGRDEVARRVRLADESLDRLTRDTARFERLAHEPQIVLVGRPNAGKSTLLNALAGRERAVVSPIAGTTRDAVSADVRLRRGTVKLIDVAGLDTPELTDDIARQMQSHAQRATETSDIVVLVRDSTDTEGPLELPRDPDVVVLTKSDLIDSANVVTTGDHATVSAVTGANMEEFREKLDALAFGDDSARPALALNARHLAAIADARAALGRASQNIDAGAEVVAFELREALDALGRVLGQVSPDDLLDRIFSRFCIGK